MRVGCRSWSRLGRIGLRESSKFFVGPCSSVHTGSNNNNNRLEGAGQRWAKLESRALVRIQGAEVPNFLQGLLTNDASFLLPRSQTLPALSAFLLNTSGRVVDDVIVYNCSSGEKSDDFLLECSKENYKTVVSTLIKYRMRKKIDLTGCTDTLSILVVFPNFQSLIEPPVEDPDILPGTISGAGMKENRGPVAGVQDPRLPWLGSRIIIPSEEEAHPFVPIHKDLQSTEESYRLCRYAIGVAEGPPEIISAKSLPLECNGDYLNQISFHKGCYIGQELTARTHHAGVVRKRMMPLLFDSVIDDPLPLESKIIDSSNKVVGRLRGHNRNFGIALMRVTEALDASELALSIESEGSNHQIPCRTWTPTWWNQAEEIGKIRGFKPNPPPE